MKTSLIYTIFAAIATAVNIGAQDISIRIYDGSHNIFVAMLVGTGTGLLVKYLLDKRYIFRFTARSAIHDGKIFLLYALMGIITTFIFWGFELIFEYFFATKQMRYFGGVIGLVIGYIVKYALDKRFVFNSETT